jgi:hypothetical protein
VTPAGALAAAALVAGFVAAVALALPAIRRTGLALVHPAVAWLALHGLFLGIGSAALSAAGSIDPRAAWYVAGAAIATTAAIAASDRLARHRRAPAPTPSPAVGRETPDPAPARRSVVIVLLGLAGLAIAPALLATGLPLLADDPTGARVELAGLAVQPVRVALPAAALVAILAALRRPSRRRTGLAIAATVAALAFTLLLASRYLAAELAAALIVGWLLAGRRIAGRAVVAVAIAGIVVFAGVQVIRAPELAAGRELAFAIERTVSRVVLVQPRTLDALVEAIPAEEPHFGGLTWVRRLGPVLGRDDIPNLGYWVYPRVFPDQDPEVPGYAAPGLIGEAWANLGWLGLVLFVGLGVLLERLGALLARRRTGTGDVAAGAVAVVVLARTHALGLNGALVLLALVVAWRLLASGGIRGLADDAAAVSRWRA